MKSVLAFAAVAETATGLILLVSPSIVVRLLFAAEMAGPSIVISRVAGVSLIALGLACRPGEVGSRALSAMFIYSSLVGVYFIYLGLDGEWVGRLLWVAGAVHVLLAILLAGEWFKEQKAQGRNAARQT